MTKSDRQDTLTGNDGTWFLDAVAPPVGPTDQADAAAPASPVTETTIEQSGLDSWTPSAEEPSSRRPLIIVGVVVAVAVVAALILAVWLSGTSQSAADEEAARYTTALSEMQAVLPQTQQILGNVTDPFQDPESLPSLEPLLADLEVTSDRVIRLAKEPLPEPLPLASVEPFEALESTKTAMVLVGEDGLVISRRINDGLAYRVLVDNLIVLPNLPTLASSEQITAIEAELAASLEASQTTLEQLPNDPAFEGHKRIAAAAVADYAAWQPRYLEELRGGDPELTAVLITQVEGLVSNVDASLDPFLGAFRSEVDTMILTLNDGIVVVVGAIP